MDPLERQVSLSAGRSAAGLRGLGTPKSAWRPGRGREPLQRSCTHFERGAIMERSTTLPAKSRLVDVSALSDRERRALLARARALEGRIFRSVEPFDDYATRVLDAGAPRDLGPGFSRIAAGIWSATTSSSITSASIEGSPSGSTTPTSGSCPNTAATIAPWPRAPPRRSAARPRAAAPAVLPRLSPPSVRVRDAGQARGHPLAFGAQPSAAPRGARAHGVAGQPPRRAAGLGAGQP